MWQDWLPLVGITVVVTTIAFLVLYAGHLWIRRSREDPSDGTEPQELILGVLTPGLAPPVTATARDVLSRELRAAGYYRPTALTEYLALRTLLVFVPLFVACVVALLADREHVFRIMIAGGVVAILGYSLPRLYIQYRGRLRARRLQRGLPLALDMLTLSLSAGQNLLASLHRVSQEIRAAHPLMADELDIVRQQAEIATLDQALQQFAQRVDLPEIRNLATILGQSERLGTDVTSSLMEYANAVRTTLRQRAEAQANRTTFWLLFPTVTCLWVAAALVIIGPAALEFRRHHLESGERIQQLQQDVTRLGTPPGAPAPPQEGPVQLAPPVQAGNF
ncbi:MAG: hypothetical protein C4297_01235 [Gemmataceae bacterium]